MLRVLLLGGQKGGWKPCLTAIRQGGIKLESFYAAHPGRLRDEKSFRSCQLILASPLILNWPREAVLNFLHGEDGSGIPVVLVGNKGVPRLTKRQIEELSWDWVSARESWRLLVLARRAIECDHLRRSLTRERDRWAGISHDVGNLLTVVLGNAEFLSARLMADESSQRAVQGILQTGELAASWMKQWITQRGETRRPSSGSDLNEVVVGTEGLLRTLAGKRVRVKLRLGVGRIPVVADPTRITRVILNLVTNARDAMPGGGHLTIATDCARKVAGTSWGRITIADTGPGIARGKQIFARSHSTKSGHYGMGLPIVRALVEETGGFLEFETAAGLGTTFRAYFPYARDFSNNKADAAAAAPASIGGSKIVLVVEDEPQLREIVSRTLRSGGYQVLEACNARQALQLREKRPGSIDLLLTDIRMAVMRGPDLARAMRAVQPEMNVIYISGYPDARLASGGDGAHFLLKPFRPAALLRKVHDALQDRGSVFEVRG